MNNTIFIGGLSWNLQSEDLKDIFAEHAEVVSANVIFDRETKRSKGFGFVEFGTTDDAVAMKDKFDGAELDGRKVFIDFARKRED